jgi:hypothetical protein
MWLSRHRITCGSPAITVSAHSATVPIPNRRASSSICAATLRMTLRSRELIDDGVQAGAFRNVNVPFAAQAVAVTIDAVQSGDLLRTTGLSAGDAFAELGDLLLDGLNRPDT